MLRYHPPPEPSLRQSNTGSRFQEGVCILISHKLPLADVAPSALLPAANGDAGSVITFGGRSLTKRLRLASSSALVIIVLDA